MLGITSFTLFLVAVFLLNVTPGPDTAYIVGRSVAQGRGAGIVSEIIIAGPGELLRAAPPATMPDGSPAAWSD